MNAHQRSDAVDDEEEETLTVEKLPLLLRQGIIINWFTFITCNTSFKGSFMCDCKLRYNVYLVSTPQDAPIQSMVICREDTFGINAALRLNSRFK